MAEWNGPVDEQGRLSAELTCRQCGYNLNGLSPTGMCPECGLEIGKSLQSDRLAFADPQWVNTLAKGAKLLAWWLILSIVAGIAVGGILGALGDPQAQAVGQSAFELLSMVIMLAAVWWITTPEPREFGRAGATPRTLARYGYAGSALFTLIAMVAAFGGTAAAAIANIPASLCGLVGLFALLTYARGLALRIPDDTLARHTRIVMWGLGIALGLGLLVLIVAVATGSPGSMPGPASPGGATSATGAAAPIAVIGCFMVVALLVFGIWAIVLAFQYSSRFSRAAEMSYQNDASAPGSVRDEPWNRGLS